MRKRSKAGWKQLLSVTVASLTAISVLSFSGCHKSQTPTTSAASSGTPTLTVAMQTNPNVEDFATNYLTKTLEEKNNVKLDFYTLPSSSADAKTKLSLMISSNTTLPDILNVAFDTNTLVDYASKGVIKPSDSFFKNASLSKNYNALVKQSDRTFVYNAMKLPDGHVYGLPYYAQAYWNEDPYRAWISSEWLTKLNLKAPTTTSELETFLKAVVAGDPNGNGKKDEIGIVGSTDGWGQNPLPFLMNSFLYANPDKNYFDVKNGKVFASFTQSEWKQGLEFMHQLVTEGLLSPLSFTQNQTQLKALVNVKGGMASIVTSGSLSVINQDIMDSSKSVYNYQLLAPLKGPSGVAHSPYNPTLPTPLWLVTKNCKNVDAAYRVGDSFYTENMFLIGRYGEKGVDWSDDPSVTSQYILSDDAVAAGEKVDIADLKGGKLWGQPQNKDWQSTKPTFFSEASKTCFPIVSITPKGTAIKGPDMNVVYNKLYAPVFPDKKNVITQLAYTTEETQSIADAKTAIDQYVLQSAAEFITGSQALTQASWDNYLGELNKMGLKDYLAATQKAYDRNK